MSKVNEAKAIPTRFTPEVEKAITGLMKATDALDLKRESVIDALRAAGIKSTDFISPKGKGSTATPELNAAFKAAIVKGFPAAKRKLLNAPKGSLSKEQMKLRRDHQQSIGGLHGCIQARSTGEGAGRDSQGQGQEGSRSSGTTASPAKPRRQGQRPRYWSHYNRRPSGRRQLKQPEFDVVELVDLLAKAQQIVVKH